MSQIASGASKWEVTDRKNPETCLYGLLCTYIYAEKYITHLCDQFICRCIHTENKAAMISKKLFLQFPLAR